VSVSDPSSDRTAASKRRRGRGPEVQLNLQVRGLPPSATVAINARSNELRAQGRWIAKLGLGQSPFPVPEPVVQALRDHADEKDYLPTKGLWELREAVAAHHCAAFGHECHPEDVLVGPGSKELMFLLQLVYYGDLVIPTPAWVSYAPQARIIGRQVQQIPTRAEDRWLLTPKQLDAFCRDDPERPRIVVLNYPANPTGTSYTGDQLAALARVARRYKAVVLADEIYGKIHHAAEHASIVPLYWEGTLYSDGLSKWCGAGGWRLGIFIFPRRMRWLLDAMAAAASETYTSTSAPIQYAAVRAFQGGEVIEVYLRRCRRALRALGQRLTEKLAAVGVKVVPPDGGFYLFPDFSEYAESFRRRGLHTGRDVTERLLEDTGVALLPGSDFGRPVEEPTARLAYVDFDGQAVLDAVAELPEDAPLDDDFLHRYCGRVIEGVDRLCDWLQG